MANKSRGLKNGDRLKLLNKTFWARFKRESGVEISYLDFLKVIQESNLKIQDRILSNISGFKFPEALGFSAVSRYKPAVSTSFKQIDWKKTKEHNTIVYHTNFHSFGYKARVLWLTDKLSSCKNINVYKLTAERKMVRKLSKNLFDGKVYTEYKYDDFKTRKIRINLDKFMK